MFFDCIDIICAFSTLALVLKKQKKKRNERSLLGFRLKQGEQVWKKRSWYFNFSVIAPFALWQVPLWCARVRESECVRACVYLEARNFVLVFEAFLRHTQKQHAVVELKGITDWTLIFGCAEPHMDQRMIHDCNYEQFKLTHVFI